MDSSRGLASRSTEISSHVFHQILRSRHNRWLIAVCSLLVLFALTLSSTNHLPDKAPFRLSALHIHPSDSLAQIYNSLTGSNITTTTATDKVNPKKSTIVPKKSRFHVVLPTHEDAQICRTLLSASILGYPSPILIPLPRLAPNEWLDRLIEFISNASDLKDDDLIMVADGSKTWFQLPADLFVARALALVDKSNQQLFSSKNNVIIGASAFCEGSSPSNSTCRSPLSPMATLSKKIDAAFTNPASFSALARIISPSMIVSRVGALKIFLHESDRLLRSATGESPDLASIFASIIVEQTAVRRNATLGRTTTDKVRDWITYKLGDHPSRFRVHHTNNATNSTSDDTLPLDLAVSLDVGSTLGAPMLNDDDQLVSVHYNNRTQLQKTRMEYDTLALRLPQDLAASYHPLGDLLGYQQIPHANGSASLQNVTWLQLPLMSDLRVPSVPASVEISPQRPNYNLLWENMWFHPFARDLLRYRIKVPELDAPAALAAIAELSHWNTRGGLGGAWTEGGAWLSWDDLCTGREDDVFGDGRGPWGKEGGNENVYSSWGKLLAGEEEEEEGKK